MVTARQGRGYVRDLVNSKRVRPVITPYPCNYRPDPLDILKPVIAGLPIGPDASGRKDIVGPLQVLSAADWSLMHRG